MKADFNTLLMGPTEGQLRVRAEQARCFREEIENLFMSHGVVCDLSIHPVVGGSSVAVESRETRGSPCGQEAALFQNGVDFSETPNVHEGPKTDS